tara:strand:+ start:312 stop:854 length:543 start_codon:yes stop_codon:yes gene_type:complete
MHNLEYLLAELSKDLQRSDQDLSELLNDLASYSNSYERAENPNDVCIKQFEKFQERIKSVSKRARVRKIEENALRTWDRGHTRPSYVTSSLVFPKGKNTGKLLDSHKTFAKQFDEMFGDSWLKFSDNFDPDDLNLNDVEIFKVNAELKHLERWYGIAFLEDRSEFDDFLQEMKRLSQYSN